ncbi:(5-formylfuran-3-yl)methyl phosphate synthase, partial [Klebsiella aerogenes]
PEDGPLGALPPEHVSAILAAVAGRALTSAVAEPQAVAAMAGTGADYVKVAAGPLLREGGLADAASAARGRLVAVLFAEDGIP